MLCVCDKEPVSEFLACLEQHARVREMPGSTTYWVCAYANNQHRVEDDIMCNPRSTSFYRAMQMCEGVLLVLDSAGTPFQRIWCCFEQSIAAASIPLLNMLACSEHVGTDCPGPLLHSAIWQCSLSRRVTKPSSAAVPHLQNSPFKFHSLEGSQRTAWFGQFRV